MGFECSLENSYSHDSFPLSVKEVFIGSPYSWRTCAWVVLPLTNCPDTVCCEASAMLSLPLLAHPPRNADESPAATAIRHAITPPNAVARELLLTAGHRTTAAHYQSTHLPAMRRIGIWSDRPMIVNDNTGRQQMIPNKSCRESSGPRFKVGWCFGLPPKQTFGSAIKMSALGQ